MSSLREKYVGNKQFYRSVIVLVIPIIIQLAITNFVGLLDNIMVGGLGTESISAVAIVNQLIFVFNLTIFGGISGASIFGAQFAGSGDTEGLRQSFRFKLIFGIVMGVVAIFVFVFFGEFLIKSFMQSEDANQSQIDLSLSEGVKYLSVMIFGLIPFVLVQSYSGTLREVGETVAPMTSGIIAVFVNLILNYLLIAGNLGAPSLGVVGAALGTVISRYVELAYILIITHRNKLKFQFVVGLYKSLHISRDLVKKIAITGLPLIVNETMWSIGMTVINQSYSVRGLDVVASVNISATTFNLCRVIMFGLGSAVSILVGQALGSGNSEKAKQTSNQLLFFALATHVALGITLFFVSPYMTLFYNTGDNVREMAASMMRITAIAMPLQAVTHVIYFTLRSGGKTMVTFLFDCVYTWVIPVPISFILARYTGVPVIYIYAVVQFVDVIKVCIGFPLLKSGFWAKNIIEKVK